MTAERIKAQRRAKRMPPAIMAIVVMRTGDDGGESEAFAAGSTGGFGLKGLKGANGLKAVEMAVRSGLSMGLSKMSHNKTLTCRNISLLGRIGGVERGQDIIGVERGRGRGA